MLGDRASRMEEPPRLVDFLREAGLAGYAYSLEEAGFRTALDVLTEEQPLELLDLSYVEEQRFIRALVELRRRVFPPLPLPPGKTVHFYISHSRRDLVEPLVASLEKAGATIYTHHVVTYKRTQGSISRWSIPRMGFAASGTHRTAERLGTGNYQHQYGGGGSRGGVTLSPAVTQQLSMHRDLSQSLASFSDEIAKAHPSHRRVLGETSSSTSGLDETTERGAEQFVRETRHMILLLSEGTLKKEYVLQELRWAVQHCVQIIGLYEEGTDLWLELSGSPPDLKPELLKVDFRAFETGIELPVGTASSAAEDFATTDEEEGADPVLDSTLEENTSARKDQGLTVELPTE
jgi:hypothetical protein